MNYNKKQIKQQNKNKQNNLSFRNIAANSQYQNQNLIKNNINTKSFKSICDVSGSFWSSGDDRQEDINYGGSCLNHRNKIAEYVQANSLQRYCKLCAAKLASLGYKLQKSEQSMSRDISPSLQRLKRKQDKSQSRRTNEIIFQSRIRFNKNDSTLNFPLSSHYQNNNKAPVKFSTLLSQKTKSQQNIQGQFEQNQRMIEEYVEIYQQKMQKIQELLNDIKIKDTLYINKLKAENKKIYEQLKIKQHTQGQRNNFDLFGKFLLKDSGHNKMKLQLPSQQKIQKLQTIYQKIQSISKQNQNDYYSQMNQMALIKSITSIQSNKTKQMILKNSSSISNLSSKSNFKKQKAIHEKKQKNIKFNDDFNQSRKGIPINQVEIQSSRFSSNSAIIRKKNNFNNSTLKAQSGQVKRRKTQVSFDESSSCQDTPQSIKSKISSNSFILPRNAAVTMFQKINVCQSIDIRPGEDDKQVKNVQMNTLAVNPSLNQLKQKSTQSYVQQSKSSYTNKSDNRSVSIASKGRKSFNRYSNFDGLQ